MPAITFISKDIKMYGKDKASANGDSVMMEIKPGTV